MRHERKDHAVKTTDLGNSESFVTGIMKNTDGTYTALTATQSKTFKTLKGAEKWISRRTSK